MVFNGRSCRLLVIICLFCNCSHSVSEMTGIFRCGARPGRPVTTDAYNGLPAFLAQNLLGCMLCQVSC